ncbi:MAG TPA: hypothetical protein VH309_03765, partial [Elusimicrobiota bacterium]|nr:hypothetical protein [Elusimicrobiota bacterium]
MKKSPRLTPLFVALSVVLSAAPQAALAQVVERPVAPAAMSGGAAAAGVSALATLAPAAALAPA